MFFVHGYSYTMEIHGTYYANDILGIIMTQGLGMGIERCPMIGLVGHAWTILDQCSGRFFQHSNASPRTVQKTPLAARFK